LALLGVENSDEHQIALRGLGNGECIFRDLEGRAGRIGIDLISDEMRQWLDTNPTRSRPDVDVPRAVAEPAPGEPGPAEPSGPGPGPGGPRPRRTIGRGQRLRARPIPGSPVRRRASALIRHQPATSRPIRLASAKPPVPTSGVVPMPRPFSRAPLVSRVPLTVRRAVLLLGVVAAVVGLPGTALAAVPPASPAAPAAARALATPGSPAAAGTPALVSQPSGPAGLTGPAQPGAPGGVCQVPGIGDIGGLLGFCAAGSSGLVGDINNVCQPSVPAPESATGGIDALIRPPDVAIKLPAPL